MKLFCLILLAFGLCGCSGLREKYNESKWTPDGFNYTYAADHKGFKPAQYYIGLSWSLKE